MLFESTESSRLDRPHEISEHQLKRYYHLEVGRVGMGQLLAFSKNKQNSHGGRVPSNLTPSPFALLQNVKIVAAYMPQPLVPQLLGQRGGQRQPWLWRGLAIDLDGQHIEVVVIDHLVSGQADRPLFKKLEVTVEDGDDAMLDRHSYRK